MLSSMKTIERRSLALEDRDLAQQIGGKLKAARLRAGLTQQQVAAGRYTKAYVSALENGLIKPSMAALRFLAVRLGTTPSELLTDADERWARMDAELRLAAGDWQSAVDRFQEQLDREPQGLERARVLVGLAEGLCRLGRAGDAIRHASEADERFTRAGLRDEARRARYWLAGAHHLSDSPQEAKLLFEQLLADDSEAAPLGADFRVRVLVALAAVMTQVGEPRRALSFLEEARGISADIDDRRRAALLSSLAYGYRATGDMEAAMRAGLQSLALFQAADAVVDSASVENELALIFLGLGNLREARNHASAARRSFESSGHDFLLAHVAETEAQIALADGKPDVAAEKAAAAADLARRTGNQKAEISALLTEARASRASGDGKRAGEILARAAELARGGPRPRLREILSEWSELLAETGDHQRAYELSREALSLV
jgi:transcriptional regulator with XRE-family HTH domain